MIANSILVSVSDTLTKSYCGKTNNILAKIENENCKLLPNKVNKNQVSSYHK